MFSPVWVATDADPKPFFIGEYLMLTEKQAVNALSFGMPWEEGVFLTPVAEKGKIDYLQALCLSGSSFCAIEYGLSGNRLSF